MREDFCVFILSHGRPDRIYTLKALKKANYTGKYFIVVDNEDKTYDEYKKRYKEKVLQFDKLAISKTFDTGDTQEDRRTIVYARNACFDLAKKVGCRYFLELDDDYTYFSYRMLVNGNLHDTFCLQFDRLVDAMLKFYSSTPCASVAFAQNGDFIGGANGGSFKSAIKRKAMNSFFCDVEKPFKFLGRINEDVNTYTTLATRGLLFMTILGVSLNQMDTQKNAGGMSDVYIDSGTYLKTFYSVMMCPSAVKIASIGGAGGGVCYRRIHHRISWKNCAPCILREEWRKR